MCLETVLKHFLIIICFFPFAFSHSNPNKKLISDCWFKECVVNFLDTSKYVFQTRSKSDKVRISVNLGPDFSFPNPPNCSTDYLKVKVNKFTGNGTKVSHIIYTLCEGRGPLRRLVEVEGKQVIVTFKYRRNLSQYFVNLSRNYPHQVVPNTGLLIVTARFIESINMTNPIQNIDRLYMKQNWSWAAVYNANFFQDQSIVYNQTLLPLTFYSSPIQMTASCNYIFDGNIIRKANFRLVVAERRVRSCFLIFQGKEEDTVHVTIKRSQNFSVKGKVWAKEKSNDTWSELSISTRSTFASSGTLKFIMPVSFLRNASAEHFEGFFNFHCEKTEGFIRYNQGNQIKFTETRVLQSGQIHAPPHLPSPIEGRKEVVPSTVFIPETRAILISFQRANTYSAYSYLYQRQQPFCYTRCDISSCHCETRELSLKNIDHIVVMIKRTQIACLCGLFPSLMPIQFESSSSLTIEYHFTGKNPELTYSANYTFQKKNICRNFSITRGLTFLGPGELFNMSQGDLPLTFFQCSWNIVPQNLTRLHLIIVGEEEAKVPCTLWNLTVELEVGKLNTTIDRALTSRLPRLKIHVRYIRLNIEEQDYPRINNTGQNDLMSFIDPGDIFPYESVIAIIIFVCAIVLVFWLCQIKFF